MNTYYIRIRSNKNARTINHYRNSRCYFSVITVNGDRETLKKKVAELKEKGEIILDITLRLGTRIYL